MIKNFLISFFLFSLLTNCTQEKKDSVIESIKDFRYTLNLEYANKKTSPLTEKDFLTFSSLDFYPINKKYYIKADFKRTPNETPFEMLTTTSRLAKYVKYGEATFKIEGENLKLNIYQSLSLREKPEYKDYLFLPFTDETSGKESYAGGRYIDLRIPKGGKLIIDFNKSYNPYCAYNHKYSCPIPPNENHLTVEIKAGVKKFK